MYEQIAANKRKSAALIFLFILALAALGYAFSYLTEWGAPGIAVAVVFALVSALGSYYASDKIALSISKARPATKEEFPYLVNVVEGLTIAAGIPAPRCYVIDDSAPNAFATGRDPQHAVICVTTGLLQKMDRAELEGVVAHEMTHIRFYDIRLMTLVVVLVGIMALLSDWILRSFVWGGRARRGGRDKGGGEAVLIAVGLLLAVLAPIAATLIRMAISRKREFLADAGAAELTRYPAGLASALRKIAADREPLEAANKATAHLYIANPLLDHKGKLNRLFSTHPPIEERIAALEKM
jgi:heat shock protein HtpX